MKKMIVTLLLWAGLGIAAPLLTIDPTGPLPVAPGETGYWSFRLTSDDTRWLSVIGSLLLTESNPSLGTYTDIIGSLGGPVDFALAPGAADWVVIGGLGSYTVDASGAPNSGVLRVIVEAYSANPLECGGDCVVETLTLDAAYSVEAASVPEPSTLGMVALAIGLQLSRRRKSLGLRPVMRLKSLLKKKRSL